MRKNLTRMLSFVLLAVLLFSCLPAAQAEGLRHMVTGDVSRFTVDEAAGDSAYAGEGPGSVHTDVYLFVDPDTASYITFLVTDESGTPVEGAQIFICYNGVEELYGTTAADGTCSMYLFRNVPYSYRVVKTGYEPLYGSFTARAETKRIHVVLRRLHKLDVFVLDGDLPVPGVTVYIGGAAYTADAAGHVSERLPNGVYQLTVVTDDGREITRTVEISGSDLTVIIDISRDDLLVPGGRYADRFLVYDRSYAPEDYTLREVIFRSEDLTQAEDETDAAFAARVNRYLGANTGTILVTAMPDHIQQPEGTPDVTVTDENGVPRYTQRSMMPMGWLMRAWEQQGYASVAFSNENGGVRFAMEDMHGPAMSKVFALLAALSGGDGYAGRIVKPEVLRREDGLEKAGLADLTGKEELDASGFDLTAIRDFVLAFDADPAHSGTEEPVPAEVYTNAIFEYRVTPVERASLRHMITRGLSGKEQPPLSDFVIACDGYFADRLRTLKACGYLTATEADELYALLVDGVVTQEELGTLRSLRKDGLLTDALLDRLLDASLESRIYRVSCWVRYRGISVNVTGLMEHFQAFILADALYAQEYAGQLSSLTEELRAQGTLPAEPEKQYAAELERRTEEMLPALYTGIEVTEQNLLSTDADYIPGVNTLQHAVWLLRSLPPADNEFAETLQNKVFRVLEVDVRTAAMPSPADPNRLLKRYTAAAQESFAPLPLHRALTFGGQPQSGLRFLRAMSPAGFVLSEGGI